MHYRARGRGNIASRVFLFPSLLPRTFRVDAGCLYAVLPDMSAGKAAARPRNAQSGHKTATSSIQLVMVHF